MDPQNLSVVVATGPDPQQWARDHAEGRAPDPWPYGFDKIATAGIDVSARRVPSPVRVPVRSFLPRTRPVSPDHDVLVAWDERALGRLLQHRPSARAIASGLIWATDYRGTAKQRAMAAARRRQLRQTELVWCLCRAQVDVARRWLGPGGPPVLPLRFGMDETFFGPRPYPSGRPLVFSVGIDRDRDVDTLFAATERILQARPGTEIVVQSASDRPPPEGVRVLPRVDHVELRRWYERASVVVVATRPNLHVSGMTVSLEAQATGRPVVVTGTPGMDEYVTDGFTGRIAPVGDGAAVASAVIDLLDDPAAAAAMGVRGRERVEERHTTSHMAAALRELIATAAAA